VCADVALVTQVFEKLLDEIMHPLVARRLRRLGRIIPLS
jgi:hypothetical protein